MKMGKLKTCNIISNLTFLISNHFKVVTETSAPKFMPHLSFVKPLSTNSDNQPIPIRYVATLDPPMPVSDEISQKLMTVAGLINMDGISLPVTDVKTKEFTQTQSLEDMLVMGIDENVFNSNNSWVSVSC
jgi:hypothetical protein